MRIVVQTITEVMVLVDFVVQNVLVGFLLKIIVKRLIKKLVKLSEVKITSVKKNIVCTVVYL